MDERAVRPSYPCRVAATLALLLLITFPARAVTPGERNALLALYNATAGEQWKTNTGWGGAPGTECTWTKVTCDANGSVVNLFLGSNNLVGTIPAAISELPKLQRLYMDNNKLSGPIPPEIGSLSLLSELALATNQLSGPIPPQIGSLSNLRFLYLGTNAFDGPIPPELGSLIRLQEIFLHSNKLTGEIPDLSRLTELTKLNFSSNKLTGSMTPWIGTLANLKELNFETNELIGPIPGLSALKKLEKLDLGQNRLSGAIPADLGSLIALTRLSLYSNQLSGPIPPQLGALTNLEFLYLRSNKLTGTIPPLGTLSNLKELGLERNELSGSIPSLAGFQNLQKLYLGQNKLSGTIPDLSSLAALSELSIFGNQLSGPLPAQIGSLTSLRHISIYGNQLSGPIPPLSDLRRLEFLDLSYNQLSGPIPSELGSLTALQLLRLGTNSLSGGIPNLGGLSQLKTLQLEFNRLTGEIPATLTNLTALEHLRLNANQLTGPIPADIGRLVNLIYLDLTNNQLTGPVPQSIANLSKLRELYLSGNSLTGTFLADIGKMTTLVRVHAGGNKLEGPIASDIGKITGLTQLRLSNNKISGPLPESLGDLAELTDLQLHTNQFSGPIPASLGKLTKLQILFLGYNQLTGTLPGTLANLTNLIELSVYSNQLSGTIPPEFERLTSLTRLILGLNGFTGEIPAGIGKLTKLRDVNFYSNRLRGPLPSTLGDLGELEIIAFGTNSFEGRIPPQLGKLVKLKQLFVSSNRLEGPIPRELSALTNLEKLSVDANQLTGLIPPEMISLQKLTTINLKFNGLTSNNAALNTFLAQRQTDWDQYQNVPPSDVQVTGIDATTAVLSWKTVPTKLGGAYQIGVATPPGSALSIQQTTAGKWISSAIVSGLTPATDYTFAVRAVAYPSPGANLERPYQQNQLVSDFAPPLVARTRPSDTVAPNVVVYAFPSGPLIRGLGVNRDDRYVLTNIGTAQTAITLAQSAPFFTQSPTSFTLSPGGSRTVTLKGTEQAPGVYEGTSTPSGAGVPAGLTIPVSMLAVSVGASDVVAVPSATRVDLTTETSGTVDFTNSGTDTLVGILVSDVDWIEPQSRGLIEIRPGQRVTLRFNINRAKRPVADGSLTGGLYLVYPRSVAGLLAMLDDPLSTHNPSLSVSTVSVVNTSRPPVSQTAAPPLEAGEVALFIPGIGTERGRSISDVNFVNANGASAVGNLRVYYTPETSQTASARADLPLLAPGSLVSYGNIIGSVFQSESTGTLQIRAGGAIESITASARVLNIESRDGTFGTAIPVFRSDRAVEPGGEIVLTGVRKDANTITNLFIQEMSGNPARFDIRFLDGNGAQTGGSYSGDVNPFSLRRVLDQVPTGTVTAVVTNARDSAGRIGAYATPRDTRSGDFWSVVDWSRTFGFQRFEPMVIPFVESARGVDKFSRSDLVISNRASSLQKGTLRFISPSSPVIESLVALDAGKSRSLADLLGESFHLTSGEGYLLFAPQCDAFDESLGIGACDAAFSLASRNFASGSDPGTYGTAVPALGLASALRSGQSRLIGGIEDVERSRGPGTYRTEVGLLETAGAPATVRITVLTRETRGTISFVSGTSRDILLGPREYKKINGIATYVLGGGATGVPGSGGTGRRRAAGTPRSVLSTSTLEIRNASLLFQVLSGDGAVIVFASAIDNGTGDALLRVE